MFITHRIVILAVVGFLPIILWPTYATVFILLGVLLLVAGVDVLLACSPRVIRIARSTNPPTRLHEPITVWVELTNESTKTLRGQARDGWQPSAHDPHPLQILRISPGQTQRLTTVLQPSRRGVVGTRTLTIRSVGPLGFAGRQMTHRAQGEVTVVPPFRSRRQLPSRIQQLRELEGRSAIHQPGAGHEFDALREYVRGDDVRTIDWRASARAQELIVRTYRPERDRRVIIVLDSSRAAAVRVGDETRFDAGVEAALFMAALAHAGGDRVDLLTLDQHIRARSSSEQPGHLLHRIATDVAPVFPRLLAADWTQLPPEVASITRQRALLVLVTPLDSAAVEEGLIPVLPMLTAKHVVLIAAVADPELDTIAQRRDTTEHTFLAASAAAQQLRNQQLVQLFQQFGVEVVQASPTLLPTAIGDAYLRLKTAGRL